MKRKAIVWGIAGGALLAFVSGIAHFGSNRDAVGTGAVDAARTGSPVFVAAVKGIDPTVEAEVLRNAPARPAAPADVWTVVDERQTAQADGTVLQERLVSIGGEQPSRLVVETLRKDDAKRRFEPSGRTEMVADHLLVSLREGETVDGLQKLAERCGASVARALSDGRTYVVRLQAPSLDAVREAVEFFGQEAASVAYAEPDYVRHLSKVPNDLMYGELWGLPKISAPGAWDTRTGSYGTVVAVIDTGMDMDHPDLAANLWINSGEIAGDGLDNDGNGYVDDVNGWDFVTEDKDPNDGDGHGTHCAGTIGAVGNNANQVVGVCWTVGLMPLRVGTAQGLLDSDIVEGIRYAARNGAKVLSNSYGGPGFSQTTYDAISYANDRGCIFVAAAGNDAVDNDVLPHYPSSYNLPNVIAVAASDQNDQLASFSNYGATSVDIAAPGVDIVSTYLDGSTAPLSGTSMACPHVAGALALLASYDPQIAPAAAKDLLLASVDPIASLAGKVVSGGRMNVQTMFASASDTDADGMPDSWETDHGLDPSDPADALVDGDGDFLINLEEFRNGCDPANPDSDGDSLVDGWEVRYGFNPINVWGALPRLQYVGFNSDCQDTRDLVVANGFAYVADGQYGLKILSLARPETPQLVGSVATSGSARGVAVEGGYAYVADAVTGLFVVDVSDPYHPQVKGTLAQPAQKVAVGGGFAYLAASTNGLRVVSIANPANPYETTSFTGNYDPSFSVNDVALVGATVFMALDGGLGQIATSAQPSTYSVKAIADGEGHRNCTAVQYTGSALLLTLQDYGCFAYDTSKVLLGSRETPGSAEDVAWNEGLIYIADGVKGLRILTGSNLANMGQHDAYANAPAYGIAVANGFAYVAGKTTGLHIYRSSVDADGDGLYDGWEIQHFGSLSQTWTNDFDNDGIINWGEYLAGLDPTLADQDGDHLVDGIDEVRTWNTDPRKKDTDGDGLDDDAEVLVHGTDPYLFDTDGDGMGDQWELANGLDPLVDDGGLDADTDGATNYEEFVAQSDPNNPDTDGDGMWDGWEIDMGLDPLTNDASLDPDGDTLTNLQEYGYNTHPLKADTDDDGLTDAEEINTYGTDPLDPDTDGDLMPDGWEVDNGLDPIVDDAADDLDGDGLTNYQEYLNGSNPNNADTDGDTFRDDVEFAWGTQATNFWDPVVVDDDHPGEPEDGWGDPLVSNPDENGTALLPFDAIQEGIDSIHLVDGMTVMVTNGYYIGAGNMNIDPRGKKIRIMSFGDVADTIVDGDGLGPCFLVQSGETTNTLISGFTITSPAGACSDGDCGYEDGIVCRDGSSPTIENCWIVGCALNAVDCTGGSDPVLNGLAITNCNIGIYSAGGSTPAIVNTTIDGCRLGVYAIDSTGLRIEGSVVTGCGGRGVSVLNDADCTVIATRIEGNLGGLKAVGSSLAVDQCTIQGNIAPDYYAVGAATFKSPVNIALLAADTEGMSDIADEDENGAGILVVGGSSLSIQNSLLADNNAVALDPDYPENKSVPDYGLGGGLYVGAGCVFTNYNCTYAGNAARRGGGLSNHGDYTQKIRNTILWGNTTEDKWVDHLSYSTTNWVIGNISGNVTNMVPQVQTVETNILVVVATPTYRSIHCRHGALDVWYSDVQNGGTYIKPVKRVIETDPQFAAGYRLSGASPCIDYGTISGAPLYDLEGVARPLDGNNDGVAKIDFGAFEYVHPIADTDGDGVSDQDEIIAGTDPTVAGSASPLASYLAFYGLASAEADDDGDGMANYEEFVAGTSPVDASSFFHITDIRPLQGGGCEVVFDTAVGCTYSVYCCSQIGGGWTLLVAEIAGDGAPVAVQDTVNDGACFYKAEVRR